VLDPRAGIYFARDSQAQALAQATRKVIVTRQAGKGAKQKPPAHNHDRCQVAFPMVEPGRRFNLRLRAWLGQGQIA